MARIDAAAIRIDRQWVTAADVVDAAIAHVRHALDGHALRVDADEDLEAESIRAWLRLRSRMCSRTPHCTRLPIVTSLCRPGSKTTACMCR